MSSDKGLSKVSPQALAPAIAQPAASAKPLLEQTPSGRLIADRMKTTRRAHGRFLNRSTTFARGVSSLSTAHPSASAFNMYERVGLCQMLASLTGTRCASSPMSPFRTSLFVRGRDARTDRRDAYLRRKDMRNSCVNGEILAAVEQGARSDRPKLRTNNPERTKLDISNAAMDEFA